MSNNLYVYYQKDGGLDAWNVAYATDDLSEKKPTFVTILAVDTILAKDSPKELKDKAKYQGPMYFDLDSDNVEESIKGANELVAKLKEKGLEESDLQIFLSGKKGLHILVPQVCFLPKVAPIHGLPAIYKEIAFALAVDTVDFRVYTAKMGRMLRTCYNVRENGNYKVPVSLTELSTLTAESYKDLCASPRQQTWHDPKFRTGMALLFDFASQKVGKIKPKPHKPTPPAVIHQTLPIFSSIVNCEEPLQSGFNNIAMQLSLFAREAAWDEDSFVSRCEHLVKNHQSDGSRYNTPRKREAELRRMFAYVDENTGLEYSLGGLKALTGKKEVTETGEFVMELSAGVTKGAGCYLAAKGEDGQAPISSFVFTDSVCLVDKTGRILTIRAKIGAQQVDLNPNTFTSSSGLQNAVSSFGGTFTGSDTHARGIYQIMLKEVTEKRFIVDSEGINVLNINIDGTPSEFIVWADRGGVKCAIDLAAQGIGLEFQGYPDPNGVIKTDLLTAPELSAWIDGGENQARFVKSLTSLMGAHTPEVIGKVLGWTLASFYKPLFIAEHSKFPLLHVYGPSGNGKTETVVSTMRLFFNKAEAALLTPGSTAFALQTNMSGSSSVPIVLDEYKPHRMNTEKLEQYRAILRDAYNSKEVQRGGGNKSNDKYNALNVSVMSAPLVFIAEAPETETAIVERSVMVSFKRLAGKQMATCFKNAMTFYADKEPLTSVGLAVANKIVGQADRSVLLRDFDRLLNWANRKYLPQPDDYEKFENGELTATEFQAKAMMRPRNVFNATVSCFGLSVLKSILLETLGEAAYKADFEERMTAMSNAVFLGMEALADATVPEYVKVLQVMSDMSRITGSDQFKLVEREDYSITEYADQTVLVLAARSAYRKYRSYMRYTDSSPMYPSDAAFEMALRDIPQFMRQSSSTEKQHMPSVVLDYQALARIGVPAFDGKVRKADWLIVE